MVGYEQWPVFPSSERWQEIRTTLWSTSVSTSDDLRHSLQTKTKDDYGLLLYDSVQFLWSSSMAIGRYLKNDVRVFATTTQQRNQIGPNNISTDMIILSVASPDFLYNVSLDVFVFWSSAFLSRVYLFWRNRQMRRRDGNHCLPDDNSNDDARNRKPTITTTNNNDRHLSSPKYVKATITEGYKDSSLQQTMMQMQTLKTSLRKIGYDPETKRQEKLQHLRQQNRMVLPPPQEIMTSTTKSATSSDRNGNSRSRTTDGNRNRNHTTKTTQRNTNTNTMTRTHDSSRTRGGYLGLSSARLQQARQSLQHKDKLRRRRVHHTYYHTPSAPNDTTARPSLHHKRDTVRKRREHTTTPPGPPPSSAVTSNSSSNETED